jgi:hypothetical protein
MQGKEQTEFKSTVKSWLKSHGLDYRWIAEQCGVSEITVRNWMSQKNIPPLKRQLLERMMVQLPSSEISTAPSSVPGVSVNATLSLTIHLAPEMYNRLAERALASGSTMENMVAQAITRLLKSESGGLNPRKVILPDK